MSKHKQDDNYSNIILICIILLGIAWSLYCRLRVLEFVARR